MNAPGLIPMQSQGLRKGGPPARPASRASAMPSFTRNTSEGHAGDDDRPGEHLGTYLCHSRMAERESTTMTTVADAPTQTPVRPPVILPTAEGDTGVGRGSPPWTTRRSGSCTRSPRWVSSASADRGAADRCSSPSPTHRPHRLPVQPDLHHARHDDGVPARHAAVDRPSRTTSCRS